MALMSETYNLTTVPSRLLTRQRHPLQKNCLMKIHPDATHAQSITAYGPGWVKVGAERIEGSVVISSGGERFAWNCSSFEDLSEAHFTQLAALDAEIVIFGSGKRLRFPPAHLSRALIERQIGMETMDSQAACRTYSVLVAEGRKVVVALLLEASA
jgi:uncharacterized protein